jgi:hypothetical protein
MFVSDFDDAHRSGVAKPGAETRMVAPNSISLARASPRREGVTDDLWALPCNEGMRSWWCWYSLILRGGRRQARRAPRGSAAIMSFGLPQHTCIFCRHFSHLHIAACCGMYLDSPKIIQIYVKRHMCLTNAHLEQRRQSRPIGHSGVEAGTRYLGIFDMGEAGTFHNARCGGLDSPFGRLPSGVGDKLLGSFQGQHCDCMHLLASYSHTFTFVAAHFVPYSGLVSRSLHFLFY